MNCTNFPPLSPLASEPKMEYSSKSSWTPEQNKMFETALAEFDQDTPDRWRNVAHRVGGKSVEEVKRHYKLLLEDVDRIERGQKPQANYGSSRNRG